MTGGSWAPLFPSGMSALVLVEAYRLFGSIGARRSVLRWLLKYRPIPCMLDVFVRLSGLMAAVGSQLAMLWSEVERRTGLPHGLGLLATFVLGFAFALPFPEVMSFCSPFSVPTK